MVSQDSVNVLVIWRDKHLTVEVSANSKVLEFGRKLQKLTDVNSDTLRLLVPQSKSKSARLISPFSDEHKNLSLLEASILEGKPVRMMGAFDDEVKEVSEASSKSDQRILGFDEEEKRLWLRTSSSPQVSLKLPQGAYIFCDFRTLQLPGIELNPPPSEALRRMHMLACDPGIIAIMNKHRWRVGIMTEMAPEGYVGISPECILGFNRNHGEEISLRLRTDDLKGFRKYESIKKTLLHELAHMVFSEHDGNFYAFDKQVNQEAANLDWTKSRSHTLMSGHKGSNFYEADLDLGAISAEIGQKLGGTSNPLANARVTSVAAAYNRILKSSPKETSPSSKTHLSGADEPDPDDSELSEVQQRTISEPDPDDTLMSETYSEPSMELSIGAEEPDPDDFLDNNMMCEPDPDDCEPDPDDCLDNKRMREPDPDDSEIGIVDANCGNMVEPDPDDDESASNVAAQKLVEPDPDECDKVIRSSNNLESDEIERAEPDPDDHPDELNTEVLKRIEEPVALANARVTSVAAAYNSILKLSPKETSPSSKTHLSGADEPDPDDSELNEVQQRTIAESDPDDTLITETYSEPSMELSVGAEEPDPDDFLDNSMMCEPDPDDCEPDPDDWLDNKRMREPEPDDSEIGMVDANCRNMVEPDPDDDESASNVTAQKLVEPDPDECDKVIRSSNNLEADEIERAQPDSDDHPDELNFEVLKRIEEPVAAFCSRIQSAIKKIRAELTPAEADSALQTLYKIIRNVIEHPEEVKFRRLRKSNPHFQRSVVKYKAAVDVLTIVGFGEEVISDNSSRGDIYLILKRNDPGLLWLAKSSVEVSMA